MMQNPMINHVMMSMMSNPQHPLLPCSLTTSSLPARLNTLDR